MTEVLPLVYFTHAELKQKDNLNASIEYITEQSSSSVSSFKKATKRLRLTIQDENMNYEALEEDDQPYMIGILDKKSGNISVKNTPYFLLKPECYISSKSEDKPSLSVDPAASYSDKLNSLTAAFGSSKKRKAMVTKIKNKLDVETLETAVGNAVKESISQARQEPATAHVQPEEDSSLLEQFSIIPVPNKDAKSPNEVYPLCEALSLDQHELDRFTLELSKKFAIATNESIRQWQESGVYPEYVCEYLSKLVNSKSNQKYRVEKAKQLAFLSYLIRLYQLKAAQMRAKAPMAAYEVPESAASKLFGLYTVSSNANAQGKSMRSMPRRLKDKLTCHILVMALHLEDFSTSLDLLQKDMKLSMQRLHDFCVALGCFVRSQITTVNKKKYVTKIANLTLPLNDAGKVQVKKKARKN